MGHPRTFRGHRTAVNFTSPVFREQKAGEEELASAPALMDPVWKKPEGNGKENRTLALLIDSQMGTACKIEAKGNHGILVGFVIGNW